MRFRKLKLGLSAVTRILCVLCVLCGGLAAQDSLRIGPGVKISSGVRIARAVSAQQAPALAQPVVFGGSGATFGQANRAGNLIVVEIGWYGPTVELGTPAVTDSAGNTYAAASPATAGAAGFPRGAIYYAKNIAAYASNAVTVHYSGTPSAPEVRILEFSGIDTASPLDKNASASGTYTCTTCVQTSVATPAVTTTSPVELLVGGGSATWAYAAPGVNYQGQVRSGQGDLAEYRVVNAIGSYAGDGVLTAHSQNWAMALATFKAAGQTVVVPAPTLDSVTPNSGSTAGGTAVVLAGANFASGAAVTFGGAAAANVQVVSASTINAQTPAHAAGAVDVTVTNPGASPVALTAGYTYVAPPASTDRYVANAGSDAADGSQAAPWATIAYAAQHIPAGGTIHVAAGSYAPSLIDCSAGATQGTSTAPITLISDQERQALLTSGGGTADPLYLANCNYWNIVGFRAEYGDSAAWPTGGVAGLADIYLYQTDHVTVRRNLLRRTNRYWNGAGVALNHSTNAVVEENELYEYHAHGIMAYYAASGSNIIRRNYCNSRGYTDLPAGTPGAFVSEDITRGDQCVMIYGESNDVVENNISEGQAHSFLVRPGGTGRADNNKFYGNVARNCRYGFVLQANSGDGTQTQDDAHMPHGNIVENNVGGCGYDTVANFSSESAKTTAFNRDTAFSTAGLPAFWAVRHDDNGGDGAYSASFSRDLAMGYSASSGFYAYASSGTIATSGGYVNAYGFTTPFTGMTGVSSQTTSDPQLAACIVWRPDGSWAKTNDLGADVLYRYDNGTLTSIPLWGDDGSFPHGAVIAGWNDTPGDSLFDINLRLKVNTSTCPFPAGYGSGTVSRTLTLSVSGPGTVTSTPSGINCGAGCTASFPQGTSVRLDAAAGSGASFSGWGGACSGSDSSCTITMDTDKSATAAFTQQQGGGPYSITNQQPTSYQFYAGSVFTQPLPSDVGNHLLANNGHGYSGDQIVIHIFGGSNTNADYMLFRTEDVGNGSYGGKPFHYSTAADPIYKVVSVSAPPNPNDNPAGRYFHLTNQSCWNGKLGDQANVWWDQSTDLDSTPGGRVLTSYYFDKGLYCLPNNPCHTTACADSTPAAQLNFYYAQFAYPGQSNPYGGHSSWASMGVRPPAMFLRGQELINQDIRHAMMVNTWCEADYDFVYPATETAGKCGVLSGTVADLQRPVNGNLFWIDKDYNCNTLPNWQKGVCLAMQTYGAYLTDTGGNGSNKGIFISNSREGPRAYTDAGMRYPLFDWLAPQSGTNCSGSPVNQCMPYTFNMPGLVTSSSTHLHIVDPCVVKRMAGQPGGC